MRTSTRATLATLVAGLTILAMAPVAQGHTFNAPSTVTIDYDGRNFYGSVASARRSCTRGRKITLFKQRPGRDRRVAFDTTNRSGNYRIHRPRARGRFYVKVARRASGGYGHSHVCGRDRSPTRRVR